MNDIADRLRIHVPVMAEAADEIDRLQAEIGKLQTQIIRLHHELWQANDPTWPLPLCNSPEAVRLRAEAERDMDKRVHETVKIEQGDG